MARENPNLGVGLHVSFLCGLSALGHAQIPGLVDNEGQFSNKPGITGFRCFFDKKLRAQLQAEVVAQLEKFRATGLVRSCQRAPALSPTSHRLENSPRAAL